ncbi:MAG: BlaI/MecI/CopY family transcriptional regulator [Lachnospiraceae bacterium]|nr:BlaI/MecI/CopY family transcriptional regulator [Lachnospiraceae bacterium]
MHSRRFTGRDLDILQILWNASDSMTALEIVKQYPELTMNTVQAVLRKLLKEGLIKINRIVYSGTVLSRSFASVISPEEFVILQMKENVKEINSVNKIAFITALFEDETDTEKTLKEIEEIETVLAQQKESLQ